MATAVLSPVAQRRSPLALWHLLSLDAPCVAIVWTVFFAKLHHLSLPPTAPLALGLAVWMIYAADRLADSRHFPGSRHGKADMQERHWFHRQHRTVFLRTLALSIVPLALLVWTLPQALRLAWLLLGLPLAAYALAVHGLHSPRLPKELLVSLIFATACVVPCAHAPFAPLLHLLPETGLLAALCWLNGIAITRWESHGIHTLPRSTAWGGYHLRLLLLLAAVACLLIGFLQSPGLGLAALLCVASLYSLDTQPGLSALDRRCLADVTLLTPLLLLFWLHGSHLL